MGNFQLWGLTELADLGGEGGGGRGRGGVQDLCSHFQSVSNDCYCLPKKLISKLTCCKSAVTCDNVTNDHILRKKCHDNSHFELL